MRLAVFWGVWTLGCGDELSGHHEPPRAITLLHTADIHSHLWPFRSRISRFEAELGLGEPLSLAEVGGVARLATLVEREQKRTPALWLDSGDMLEGAEVFPRFGGQVEVDVFSALGLRAAALGNHELALGEAELGQLFATATFPWLACNVRAQADSVLRWQLVPSTVVELAGVRVGLVGVANPTSPPNLASPDNPWRLEVAPDLAAAVQAAVDDVTRRAAVVIVLSHLGLEADRSLVDNTTGIDLVLGGHQHVVTAEPEWQNDCGDRELQSQRGCSARRVPIVHSGAYGRWLSRVELRLEPDLANSGEFEPSEVRLDQLPVNGAVPAKSEVDAFLAERRPPPQAPLAFLSAPVLRRSALAGDSALGNLTSEALRVATAADVVVLNSSGLRADLEAGPLLRSDLELAFPFHEPWRSVWLTGQALRRGLERAAARSASRNCEASLQVAGMRLELHCAACSRHEPSCLDITLIGPSGDVPLNDDAWLQLVLPAYLTLKGADFDAQGSSGSELEGGAVDFIARWLSGLTPANDEEPCVSGLLAMSLNRCQEAFGALRCPLERSGAVAACRALPSFEGGHDGRIAMLP